MANIPDHDDPKIYETDIKVFKQKYWYVDEDAHVPSDTPSTCRLEVLVDDDGVFLESKEGGVNEVLSIPTPELAQRVAYHILNTYKADEDVFAQPAEVEDPKEEVVQVKFLGPEVQEEVAYQLRLLLRCRTTDLYSHIMKLSKVLDIKPAPPTPGTLAK
jgi:hypothetical protein